MEKLQELIDGLFTNGTYDARRVRTGTPSWLFDCEGETISEKVWLHFNKRKNCACGKPTAWLNYTKGYRQTCSKSCGQLMISEKKSIDRERLWASQEWHDKAVQGMKESHHKARTPGKLEKLALKGIVPLDPIKPGMKNVYRWQHRCGEIFERPFTRVSGIWCPMCHVSSGQGEVYEAVRALYPGPIVVNDRAAIGPREIDIYMPELKLGIEYHGEYWHPGDGTREADKVMYAASRGITIIEIWETLWKHKRQQQLAFVKGYLERG